MKLSPRQAEVLGELAAGETLRDIRSYYVRAGRLKYIHYNTFISLRKRKLIEYKGRDEDGYTDLYTITPAGIAAVKEGKK